MITPGDDGFIKPEKITGKELVKHNKENDCWVAIHGKVYDVTGFLHQHPGGKGVIFCKAGENATEDFDYKGHDEYHVDAIKKYYVGVYEEGEKQKPKKV